MADDRILCAARKLAVLVRDEVDAHFSLRLWNGSVEPLGHAVEPSLVVRIATPVVIASMLHRIP